MSERRRALFAEVASVNPGLISTLNALEGQLQAGPLPPADVLRAYGEYVVRLGAAVVSYAEECASASHEEAPADGRRGPIRKIRNSLS